MSDNTSADAFSIHVLLEPSDMVAASNNAMRQYSWVVRYFGSWSLLLAPLFVVAWSLTDGLELDRWSLLIPAFWLAMPVQVWFHRRQQFHKTANSPEYRSLYQSTQFQFDARGFQATCGDDTAWTDWVRVDRIDQTATHAFIVFGLAAFIFPARDFASPAEFNTAVSKMRAFHRAASTNAPSSARFEAPTSGVGFTIRPEDFENLFPDSRPYAGIKISPLLLVGPCLLAGIAAYWLATGLFARDAASIITLVFSGQVLWLVGRYTLRYENRRALRHVWERAGGLYIVVPDSGGIAIEGPGMRIRQTWTSIPVIDAFEDYCVVHLGAGRSLIVPAREFASPDEFTAFVHQLTEYRASAVPLRPGPPTLSQSPAW